MPSFVADCVAFSLNSRMMQNDGTKGQDTTVNSNGVALDAPGHCSYLEVVNHLLKRFANDESIADADAAILRLTHPAGMTPLLYGEALFAKVIRVGDVYEEGKLNDTFNGGGELVHTLQPPSLLIQTPSHRPY